MLATLAILIALLIALIKFLDEIFLTDTQKSRVHLLSLRVWNWLDEARNRSLLEILRTRRNRALVCAIVFAPALVWGASSIARLALSLVALLVVYGLLTFTLAAGTKYGIAARSIVLLVIAIIPFLIATIHPGPVTTITILENYSVRLSIGYILGTILTIFLVLLWFSMALPILVIATASTALYCSEFCVRRIAESQKGVILGLSTFLGLAGAILKAFGYG